MKQKILQLKPEFLHKKFSWTRTSREKLFKASPSGKIDVLAEIIIYRDCETKNSLLLYVVDKALATVKDLWPFSRREKQ